MVRKQKLEKRNIRSWTTGENAKQVYGRLPVMKSFDYPTRTQDWNPTFPHPLDAKSTPRFYIPEKLQSFCEHLKDLFCIDQKILLDIRYRKNNNCGMCYYRDVDGWIRIEAGASTGLRASTIVHEFLHAAGFDHEWEINGYSDYRSTCTKDTYSPLIVKDIFGIKEVLLL